MNFGKGGETGSRCQVSPTFTPLSLLIVPYSCILPTVKIKITYFASDFSRLKYYKLCRKKGRVTIYFLALQTKWVKRLMIMSTSEILLKFRHTNNNNIKDISQQFGCYHYTWVITLNDFFLCFACSQSALVCKPLSAKWFCIMNFPGAGYLYLLVCKCLSLLRTGCQMKAICWRSCMVLLSVRYHCFDAGNLSTKKIDCSAVLVNFTKDYAAK